MPHFALGRLHAMECQGPTYSKQGCSHQGSGLDRHHYVHSVGHLLLTSQNTGPACQAHNQQPCDRSSMACQKPPHKDLPDRYLVHSTGLRQVQESLPVASRPSARWAATRIRFSMIFLYPSNPRRRICTFRMLSEREP